MRDILVVIVFLLGASVSEMSTGTFVRHFTKWTNADKVTVSCYSKMIAQYCDTGNQSCRKLNKRLGVSLEKDRYERIYLTITNRTYDSWSCEAQGFIDAIRQTETFTVDFSNQHTSPSPSPGSTSSSPSPGSTSFSPSPGNHESAIAAGVTVPIIFFLLMLLLIILYQKVKCFKQAIRDFFSFLSCDNRNPKEKQEIGTGEKFLQSGSMV